MDERWDQKDKNGNRMDEDQKGKRAGQLRTRRKTMEAGQMRTNGTIMVRIEDQKVPE